MEQLDLLGKIRSMFDSLSLFFLTLVLVAFWLECAIAIICAFVAFCVTEVGYLICRTAYKKKLRELIKKVWGEYGKGED